MCALAFASLVAALIDGRLLSSRLPSWRLGSPTPVVGQLLANAPPRDTEFMDEAHHLTPEQVALLLQRVQLLEARVARLESGESARARLPQLPVRLALQVASHISTTAQRLGGKRPLPGLSVRLLPPTSIQLEAASRPRLRSRPGGGVLTPSSSAAAPERERELATAPVEAPINATARASLSSVANSVVAKTAASASAVVDLAVGKAVFVANGVATIPQRLKVDAVARSTQKGSTSRTAVAEGASTSQVSRRLLASSLFIGALVGGLLSLLFAGWRAPLMHALGRAAAGSCAAAYASTLNNRVGAISRLSAVFVLTVYEQCRLQLREMHRQFFFVYRTGRWFEQLDSQVQHLDRTVGRPMITFMENVTKPVVAVYEGISSRIEDESHAASEAARQSVSSVMGSVSSNAAWLEAQLEKKLHLRSRMSALQQQMTSVQRGTLITFNFTVRVSSDDEEPEETEPQQESEPEPVPAASRPATWTRVAASLQDPPGPADSPMVGPPGTLPPVLEAGSQFSPFNTLMYIRPR